MGRTASSIRHRASRLGISDPHHARARGEADKRWRGGRRETAKRSLAKQAAERRARNAKEHQPWSSSEDERLALLCSTMSQHQIAAALSRSIGSVKGRMGRLGLKGRGTAWQRRGEGSHNWRGGKGASDRRRKYGLEPDDIKRLLAEQGGGCALCGRLDPGTRRSFHIDHCHHTGQIRGVLCHHCNLLLGHAGDHIQTLERAIDYLRKYQSAAASP